MTACVCTSGITFWILSPSLLPGYVALFLLLGCQGEDGGGGSDEVREAEAHRRQLLLFFSIVLVAVLTFPSTFPILFLCLISNCCSSSLPLCGARPALSPSLGGGGGERRERRPMDGRIDRSKWRPGRGAGRQRGSWAAGSE